ncbi:hypothetical protein M436DRAFT_44458, partial [Aureobasidium namibiae CBS 147.97]
FDDQTLSDIKIKVGYQEYFAHKYVLVERSIWFRKALLGEFKESKQDTIDLGNDDEPAALVAMLKFCYDGVYCIRPCSPDTDIADQHLAMYRLADLYDMPDLRGYACSELLDSLSPFGESWQEIEVTNRIVLVVQKILGPEVDSFADKNIQKIVYMHVIRHVKLFYKNTLFRSLLTDGFMFNELYAQKFTDVIGGMLSHPHRRCSVCYPGWPPAPESGAWDQPVAGIRW